MVESLSDTMAQKFTKRITRLEGTPLEKASSSLPAI